MFGIKVQSQVQHSVDMRPVLCTICYGFGPIPGARHLEWLEGEPLECRHRPCGRPRALIGINLGFQSAVLSHQDGSTAKKGA